MFAGQSGDHVMPWDNVKIDHGDLVFLHLFARDLVILIDTLPKKPNVCLRLEERLTSRSEWHVLRVNLSFEVPTREAISWLSNV